ncbi:MAG TPA: RNA polymerase sigma factor [Hyphomonas sp.]|jgi:RNA polymerase sigma factor (sigma-70 family)|uniref:RNA polymerase sigma factor n=1 Tax=Hyphomonas sp. UBA5107 TaxID=1946636 RepID=UPI000C3ADA4C|nr:sigma-70 family RNA polymerase sigma factor [Hyphomonas sp. UBA5107]MAA83963.1 RNA polymerase [Hyphomonas sp.]MAN65034.1 RNA polymerase [Hyphomonadaceae bacterium]MBG66585.1 RNA polymerase [Hyphomonas sp.]HBL94447.1 RNA polymerase sigma factor [Hyphomonas sp.]HCJ19616.1 RNA polymerase sigma factor [Hyphomonas sp.]|tara:strand:- start:409 stop:1014 length:606 start_codon:yes stop_codon:yes gene_type:complete
MTTREPDSARDVRRPLVGESFALQGSAALNDIFRLQYDQFLRFSRIRIGNVPDAEDLVQDAFLSVRRAYPDKGIGELRPLLFTALRNLTLDYLKSGYAKQRRSSAEIGDLHDVLACSRSATPETQVIDAQLLAIAETAIAALGDRQREALRLSRFERLTHSEIARRLSVSPRTVRSDITDALTAISKSLARADQRRPSETE